MDTGSAGSAYRNSDKHSIKNGVFNLLISEVMSWTWWRGRIVCVRYFNIYPSVIISHNGVLKHIQWGMTSSGKPESSSFSHKQFLSSDSKKLIQNLLIGCTICAPYLPFSVTIHLWFVYIFLPHFKQIVYIVIWFFAMFFIITIQLFLTVKTPQQ